MKQAIIYTRFSPRPDAGNCQSIEHQEQACRSYCQQNGLDVLATYRDAALSGRNMDRPGLRKALQHVSKVRGVLVSYSLARLSRGTIDAISIAQQLEKKQCDLVTVTERIDTTTPYGRLYYTIMAAFGQCEREVTAERTRNILKAMQSKGIAVSKCPPYGFRRKPTDRFNDKTGKRIHILETEPEEKHGLEVILNLRRQGVSYPKICTELTRRGFKPRGKKWYPRTIANICNKRRS